MPEFTSSFFEYHKPILTESEQEAINAKLKSIYDGESILYSKDSECFEKSRRQFLALLNHYISIAPNLTLLESYKTNIQKLSKDSPPIDLYITFNVAKKKLEQFLLFFEEKYKKFDAVKFNSYFVTICYQGAYSNLMQALGISTLSDLTDLKQAFVLDLAGHYLKEANIQYRPENENHYAIGLVNYLAKRYGFIEIEDKYVHHFKKEEEIELKGFARYVEKHFNVAGFIQLVSQSPELQPPHEIVDSADKNYKEKSDQITHFFRWLGEKTEPLHELQKLYHQESDEENYTYYYRLIPKKDFRLWVELLLAEYFEKAGHVKGVSIKIGSGSLVDNGETLVRLTDEGYQTLSQEDIIALLKEAENNEEPQLTRLLEQLKAERLLEHYSTLDSSPNEALYFKVLLKQAYLPKRVIEKMYNSIPQDDTLKQKQQLIEYMVTNRHTDCSVKFLELLFANISLIEEGEQLPYLQLALKHNLVTPVNFLLETYPNVFNQNSLSLLFFAIEHSSLEIIEILLKKSAVPINALNSEGETLLYIAARRGQVNIVEILIKFGAKINQANIDGNTPMHVAAHAGYADVVEKLKQYKAVLNQKNTYGHTPLHRAVWGRHASLIETLKDEGALNQATDYGTTPLHDAVSFGYLDSVEKLLQCGAAINQANIVGRTPIHHAAQLDRVDITEKLLQWGAYIEQADHDGFTPIHYAAQVGSVDVLEKLLQFGTEINQADKDGCTPIHHAARLGRVDVVAKLIQWGADIDHADNNGFTPIHYAAQFGHVDVVEKFIKVRTDFINQVAWYSHVKIVEKLIKARADLINRVDKVRWTPLHTAVLYGHVNIVEKLIKSGADLNRADKDGHTPLHLAAHRGHVNVVKTLREGGANLKQTDNLGRTPIYIAAWEGQVSVVEELIKSGTELCNRADNNGFTPLHIAACEGHVRVVETLKDGGAELNRVDRLGRTPAYLAALGCHFEVLETLHKYGACKFNLQKVLKKLTKDEKKRFVEGLVVAKLPNVVQNIGDFMLIINELSESEKAKFTTRTLEFLIERKEYNTAKSIGRFLLKDSAEQSKISRVISIFCEKRSKATLLKGEVTPLSEQALTQLNQDILSPDKAKLGWFKCSTTSSEAICFKQIALQVVGLVPRDFEELHKDKTIQQR